MALDSSPSPDPFSTILRGIADARVDDAAAARARTQWMARHAEEGGTLTGALVDLAERRAVAQLRVRGGIEVSGTPIAVGADVVAMRTRAGVSLVRLDRVQTIRTDAAHVPAAGRAAHTDGPTLAETLREMAADHRVVRVCTDDGGAVRGELRAVGADVVTLRVGDPPTGTVLVSLDAVTMADVPNER